MAMLTFYKGSSPLFKYPINSGSIKVGRDACCDVVLPDENISREHVEFFFAGKDLKVRDLSKNGTFLNKQSVAIERLKTGDSVMIGRWSVQVQHIADEIREVTVKARSEETKILENDEKKDLPSGISFEIGVRNRDGNTTRRKFEKAIVTIGSGSDNDIVIAHDDYISKRHCKFEHDGRTLFMVDLGSTNGVTFEGEKIHKLAVAGKTSFMIGKTEVLARMIEEEPTTAGKTALCGMIGESDAIKNIFALIRKTAPADASVLITGETGTGKELVARAIHELSTRARAPFVAINCGAIPANIIESELFGHEKGAFTGTVGDHQGVFEQANGGTIFLDEIGEMPIDLQTRLLRTLETKTVRRVGGKTDIPVDVRVVSATNQDLKKNLTTGKFREDLFYRLYVLHIDLPPLKARKNDVVVLAEHFVEMFGVAGSKVSLSSKAKRVLKAHDWPGNVRELKNTIQRAVILSEGGTITPQNIIIAELSSPTGGVAPLKNQEKDAVVGALKTARGNQVKAATALGISRTTLSLKIKKFKINVMKFVNA